MCLLKEKMTLFYTSWNLPSYKTNALLLKDLLQPQHNLQEQKGKNLLMSN
ncbi:hypothetical protein BACI349Y_590002 [Bacillus sp. 349Y]|nr:hypothetical protein BACI349Y_590002 [Bacillus sp. 349Y]